MPSHWGNRDLHIVTQSSPTGSQCLPAVGCAEATRYLQDRKLGLEVFRDAVTYVFIGEGAPSEGEFWESLNTACRLALPIVYLVADNGYAISVPSKDQAPGPISELVSGFPGLLVRRFDGCDYLASRGIGAEAIARVRSGEGPALLHATVTLPYSHSSSDNQAKYRDAAELEKERERDPLVAFEAGLVSEGILSADAAEKIKADAHETAARAGAAALAGARPDPKTVSEHLLALPIIPDPPPGSESGTDFVHFGEAIRRTFHEVMAKDERVRVFGEDVADAPEELLPSLQGIGGVFGTTHGLQRIFGTDRCYNTPLAEANIVGRGGRPGLARAQAHPRGAVFRLHLAGDATDPFGDGDDALALGGDVRPSDGPAGRNRRLRNRRSDLALAVRRVDLHPHPRTNRHVPEQGARRCRHAPSSLLCDDPVRFLEHKALIRQRYAMDPFPSKEFVIPLGKAANVREGDDLTIVTWGATVHRSQVAAERLAEEGIEIEILDLRTLSPWDRESVIASVTKTSRVLVVHEDVLTGVSGLRSPPSSPTPASRSSTRRRAESARLTPGWVTSRRSRRPHCPKSTR